MGIIEGQYFSSPATITTGNTQSVLIDANGRINNNLGVLLAGEDLTNNVLVVEQRYSYANITGTTTAVVKSGAGFLHSITVNTKGASSNTFTVYDNTAGSGTKIGTIDTTATIGSLRYDVSFSTGLTVVSATGTGGDITISYR